MSYFPDYPKGILPDRNYFYTIINTIFDNKINKLIENAWKERELLRNNF